MFERVLRERIMKLKKLGFRIDDLLPDPASQNWWRSQIGTLNEDTKYEIEKRIEQLKKEVMEI